MVRVCVVLVLILAPLLRPYLWVPRVVYRNSWLNFGMPLEQIEIAQMPPEVELFVQKSAENLASTGFAAASHAHGEGHIAGSDSYLSISEYGLNLPDFHAPNPASPPAKQR